MWSRPAQPFWIVACTCLEAGSEDRARCQGAQIPDTVTFQTKPQIAQAMLEQAWAEDIPMQWVVGDSLYGNSPSLRQAMHHHGRAYVLAIGAQHQVTPVDHRQAMPLNTLITGLPEADWERLCFRIGEKGLIWYAWQAVRVTLANDTIGEQWLLIQRTLDVEPSYTFWLSNAPVDTPIATLAAVALARHPLEHLLEEAKGQIGMADYEVRHWHGWHRHMTLVMMAHTWLKLLQHDQREKKHAAHLVELQPG